MSALGFFKLFIFNTFNFFFVPHCLECSFWKKYYRAILTVLWFHVTGPFKKSTMFHQASSFCTFKSCRWWLFKWWNCSNNSKYSKWHCFIQVFQFLPEIGFVCWCLIIFLLRVSSKLTNLKLDRGLPLKCFDITANRSINIIQI